MTKKDMERYEAQKKNCLSHTYYIYFNAIHKVFLV